VDASDPSSAIVERDDACKKTGIESQESVRLPPLLRRSVMAECSDQAGILPLGWDWCLGNILRVDVRHCSE
jgi:hypothetical protein